MPRSTGQDSHVRGALLVPPGYGRAPQLSPTGRLAHADEVVGGKLVALYRILVMTGHLCEEMLLGADEALQAHNPRRHARELLFFRKEFLDKPGMYFSQLSTKVMLP